MAGASSLCPGEETSGESGRLGEEKGVGEGVQITKYQETNQEF